MALASSSIFSPRVGLPSTPQSAASSSNLHRPWEQAPPSSSSTSSDTSNNSSLISSSFPFLSCSASAPVTPSGLNSSSHSPYWSYPLTHLLQHPHANPQHGALDSPLSSPSQLMMAGLNSPFPAAAAGQYLAQLNAATTSAATNGSGAGKGGRNLAVPPSSPTMMPHGNPYSPFPPWSAPLSVQSFPLPSMPFKIVKSLKSSPLTNGKSDTQPASSSTHLAADHTVSTSQTPSSSSATPATGPTCPQKSPPKKKRKPPPIKIDSSINNFAADTAHLHGQNLRLATGPASAGHLIATSGGPSFSSLLSPGLHRSALSLPPSTPLMAAQVHFHMYQQQAEQQQHNALRYMYEGPLTPLPSSGYGSVDSHLGLGWPTPLNFAFLCFLPGTKLRFGGGENSVKGDWQPVEFFRQDNSNIDFGRVFRVIRYVKNDQEGTSVNSVELTLHPMDLPDNLNLVVRALCAPFHPFFDVTRGWVSLDPQLTRELYGLSCQMLQPFDTIAVNPACPERADHSWHTADFSGTNILAEWAAHNHRALSMESHGDVYNWTHHYQPSTPSTPRGTKVKVKKEKKEKNLDKAKRPMNAFMLYAQTHRMQLTQLWPGRDNRAISCVLGESWKTLPAEERQKYTDAAKKLADEYKEKNPDCWKRRPRSADAALPIDGMPVDGHLMNYAMQETKTEDQDEPLDMRDVNRVEDVQYPVFLVKREEEAPRERLSEV